MSNFDQKIEKEGPSFYVKKENKRINLDLYKDNLGEYKGFQPFLSKNHEMIVKQPHGNEFKANIQIRQCQANVDNLQCKNSTHIQPYCKDHLKEILNLEVKTSTIQNAGDGLFAYKKDGGLVFKPHQPIYCFQGEILSNENFRQRYGAKYDKTDELWFTPYAARLDKDHIIDCLIVRGVMSCANDIRTEWQTNVYEKYDEETGELKCYANRRIFHGEELFISYGIAWWIAFDHSYPGENGISKY